MTSVKGFIDRAERLSSYTKSIDLFIGGIGQEERFARGWNILRETGVTVNNKIIFYFNEVLNSWSDRENEEKKFDTSFCIEHSDYKLRIDLYNEIGGLLAFRKHIESSFPSIRNMNIVIDISVMIKPYIFLLLKHLDNFNAKTLYFLYAEPASYDILTKGTMIAKDVPGYSGAKDLRKKDALIILLGFEGNRAVEVLNEVNPDLTIPVNGFPSYRPNFKDRSIMENKELLSEDDILKNLCYAPANDPFETKNLLEEIYSKYSHKYNITIVPLGTKPMAFGSCLFAMEHKDCRIVYSYPKEYFPKPSKNWGDSWMYFVKLLEDNAIA